MPNWTKVLDSTTHGEDVTKRHDPNWPEVGPTGPTSQLVGLVLMPNESSPLQSEETRVFQPKAVADRPCVWPAGLPSVTPWRQFLPQH
jgi:hypothetical protein